MIDSSSQLHEDEHAHRLLLDMWIDENGKVSSAAFKTKKPDHEKYLGNPSLFVEERMTAEQDPGDLFFGKYHSRVRFPISVVRNSEYRADNKSLSNCGFDVELTPDEARPPHDAFSSSHASLTGPTWRLGAVKALALAVSGSGQIAHLSA